VKKTVEATDEFSTIPVRLKSDDIKFQQPTQKFCPPRQDFKDVGGGKWNVMKISEPELDTSLSQHMPTHHQVIIMHPDEISRRRDLLDGISKFSIYIAVDLPRCGVELTGDNTP
jgi:hypothetical protein